MKDTNLFIYNLRYKMHNAQLLLSSIITHCIVYYLKQYSSIMHYIL